MKNITFPSCYIVILTLCMNLQTSAQSVELGGGFFIATDEVFDLGLDLRGSYRFDDNWRASLILGIFLPQQEEAQFGGVISTTTVTTKYNAVAINGEANYLFPVKTNVVAPYVLAGVNFVTASVKVETSNNVFAGNAEASGDESGVSFNFGVGADFSVNKLRPFTEFKYSVGDADYAVIIAGLKFRL